MPPGSIGVTPALFKGDNRRVSYSIVDVANISDTTFDILTPESAIGLSAIYGKKAAIVAICLSSRSYAVIVRLPSGGGKRTGKSRQGFDILTEKILCNRSTQKLAFDAERIATALYHDCNLRVDRLVDIQSLHPAGDKRQSLAAYLRPFSFDVNRKAFIEAFIGSGKKNAANDEKQSVTRAWAAWILTTMESKTTLINTAAVVNTSSLDTKV